MLEAAKDLEVVSNIAVGYDNIDVAAARARGIVVTNTPDVLTDAVAEFTWALIFAITRRIGEGDRLVRRGEWKGWALDFMLGMELRGKQLGIVGRGRIGRAVARARPRSALRPCSRRDAQGAVPLTNRAGHSTMSVPECRSTSCSSADIVSIHMPLTAATRHLVDRAPSPG